MTDNSIFKQVSEIGDLFMIGSTVLFYVKDTTTVEDTIKILRAHNLHSIPVVSTEEKKVLGVLDVLDLVAFVVDVAPEKFGKEKVKLAELERCGRVLALQEVKWIVNESKRDPYVLIDAKSGGRLAFELLSRGIHRVLLSDHSGEVLGNLSQSDLVTYIHEHKKHGDNKSVLTSTTAKALVGNGSPVVSHLGERVISVLQRMKESGVSAVPVLSHDGRLKGNFSASDLKGLYEVDSSVPPFKEHIEDFLEEHSPASLSPVVVREDATLETIISTLVESKLHHIWVVDDDFKLVGRGSISLTDVLSYIYNYKL